MTVESALSVNGIPIRLTEERWAHIIEEHDELSGNLDDVVQAIADPDMVLRGRGGTLVAIKGAGRGRYLSVIYREIGGFDGVYHHGIRNQQD